MPVQFEVIVLPIVTKDDHSYIVCFQVESHTFDSTTELHHLSCLDLGETKHSCNTITN